MSKIGQFVVDELEKIGGSEIEELERSENGRIAENPERA